MHTTAKDQILRILGGDFEPSGRNIGREPKSILSDIGENVTHLYLLSATSVALRIEKRQHESIVSSGPLDVDEVSANRLHVLRSVDLSLTSCASGCADLQIDEANCGTCGNLCEPGVLCSSSVCGD